MYQVGGYSSGPEGRNTSSYKMSTLGPQPVQNTRAGFYPEMSRLGVIDPNQVSQDSLINMPKDQFDDLFFNKFAPARAKDAGYPLIDKATGRIIKTTRFDVNSPESNSTPTAKTFNEAFNEARSKGLGTFEFDGKSYNTNLGGGADSMTAGIRTEGNSGMTNVNRMYSAEVKDRDLIRKHMMGGYPQGGYLDNYQNPNMPAYSYPTTGDAYPTIGNTFNQFQQGGLMPQQQMPQEDPSYQHMQQLMNPQQGQDQQMQQVQQLAVAAAQGDQQAMQQLVQMVGEEQAMQIIQQIQQQMQGGQEEMPMQQKRGGRVKRRVHRKAGSLVYRTMKRSSKRPMSTEQFINQGKGTSNPFFGISDKPARDGRNRYGRGRNLNRIAIKGISPRTIL